MVFRLSVNIAYVFLICPFCQRKHHIHRKGKAFPEIYLLNVSNVVDICHGKNKPDNCIIYKLHAVSVYTFKCTFEICRLIESRSFEL